MNAILLVLYKSEIKNQIDSCFYYFHYLKCVYSLLMYKEKKCWKLLKWFERESKINERNRPFLYIDKKNVSKSTEICRENPALEFIAGRFYQFLFTIFRFCSWHVQSLTPATSADVVTGSNGAPITTCGRYTFVTAGCHDAPVARACARSADSSADIPPPPLAL